MLLLLLLLSKVAVVFSAICPNFSIPLGYDKRVHPAQPTWINMTMEIAQIHFVDDEKLSYKLDVRNVLKMCKCSTKFNFMSSKI